MTFSLSLIPHPNLPAPDLRLTVDVTRPTPTTLHLTYTLTGAIPALAIPPPIITTRTDDLWRHTCFEAFLRGPNGDGYTEFNFAPSTQWAAYQFTGYRDGMAPAQTVPPTIQPTTTPNSFQLAVTLTLPSPVPWRLSLTAVIEEATGRKSYWALAHPPGKPDFHDPAGFAYELAS